MTPEQIAAMITEHPDVINEISKKQLAALGLAGLVGVGSQFGSGSKIDPKKIEPIVAQEPAETRPEKPTRKSKEKSQPDDSPKKTKPSKKSKKKTPNYVRKPSAGPLQGDVDNIFALVSAMTRKDPKKLVSKDFKRVFNHFASEPEGLTKKDINKIMMRVGMSWSKRFAAMRTLEAKIGFDDGIISWDKLTGIFPELS